MSGQPCSEEMEVAQRRPEPEGCPAISQGQREALCAMGIPEDMADKALMMTGCQSVQSAAEWYFDQGEAGKMPRDAKQSANWYEMEETDESELLKAASEVTEMSFPEVPLIKPKPPLIKLVPSPYSGDVKMVFVVNDELKMGRGQIAAQVAHACLGLYRQLLQEVSSKPLLQRWERDCEPNVVLSGISAKHLEDLQKRATALSLATHLIQDAGKTQISCGSCTVLSIFGDANKVVQITGTLCLL